VSLALLTTNTYDQLLSYVVFADWLFFGLTAAGLVLVRWREPGPPAPGFAAVPGHPWTTGLFVLVAVGVVVNSFVAYPMQSLIGSAILVVAAVVFFASRAARQP
jgi:APA family basic amino acid/polyamine antiporter